jgi:hypothetical protein
MPGTRNIKTLWIVRLIEYKKDLACTGMYLAKKITKIKEPTRIIGIFFIFFKFLWRNFYQYIEKLSTVQKKLLLTLSCNAAS